MAGTSSWRVRFNDIHRIPINNFQIVRKLLSSSNNYFIEFENQGHLKIKGRDMSCTYGFREQMLVEITHSLPRVLIRGLLQAMAIPFAGGFKFDYCVVGRFVVTSCLSKKHTNNERKRH
ncbi:hypothetical protein [Labilibaculum manganireducens]|uniref:hypothetical protein n=1 Tax=Labilibaculum manganireducens TaxID=1940525 RepID=UPI0029F48720|nr:hypothetical protein [Labilibaculum manganireducens]